MNPTSDPNARRDNFNFPRWLPVAASVTLMIAAASVAAVTMAGLKDATYRRQHTFQAILAAQSFQDNLLDIQRGMRDYVAAGDTNALEQYESAVKQEPLLFIQLAELTRENPQQQQKLKSLDAAMTDILAYDGRRIEARQQGGPKPARQSDTNNVIRLVSGRALDILKVFSDEEQKLLDARDASEQTHYRDAGRLLVIASALAAALLLFANWMAGHELSHRHRVEAQLNETLALQNAVFNSANYAIVTTDKNGVVQMFNFAAERTLGYSAREVVGKTTPMLWRDPQEIAERATKLSERLGHPLRPTFETIIAKIELDRIDQGEWTFIRKDGTRFPCSLVITGLADARGNLAGYLGFFSDISERKGYEADREKLVIELREAVARVKTLSGLIPIWAWCKSIRSDTGYWQNVEEYVRTHSEAKFSHSICPNCQEKFKEEIARAGN
jgi:PAS domain S-box-containing protein